MSRYPQLTSFLSMVKDGNAPGVWTPVVGYLSEIWLADYTRTSPSNNIVETTSESFSYIFDIDEERLIAAYGVSHGRHDGARDKSRMAGHPLSAGPLFHRGHAIPHTLGGPTDINLVPQLGAINVGAFRRLEKQAVANPGSLYFTCWRYAGPKTQTPNGVDQGLLVPGRPPQVSTHQNQPG